MKNPWKRYSKINPQREGGNRQIANDVFQALIAANFTGADYKMIFAVISKTWGFNKNVDAISISQFKELTNLKKRTIQYSLKNLKALRVLISAPSSRRVQSGSPLNQYSFNKHYDTWLVEGCKNLQECNPVHPPQEPKGAVDGVLRVQSSSPTKETTTKETIYVGFDQKAAFEEAWKSYPKKDGKKQALAHYQSSVKTQADVDRFFTALSNYLSYIQNNNTSSKYIKNGSTFFNNWQDWEHQIQLEQRRGLVV